MSSTSPLKEFTNHVAKAFGLAEKDSKVVSSRHGADKDLTSPFDEWFEQSDDEKEWVDDTPPCQPGSSGTAFPKPTQNTTPVVYVPKPFLEPLSSSELINWCSEVEKKFEDKTMEWDYLPQDSPCKGKDKAKFRKREPVLNHHEEVMRYMLMHEYPMRN